MFIYDHSGNLIDCDNGLQVVDTFMFSFVS